MAQLETNPKSPKNLNADSVKDSSANASKLLECGTLQHLELKEFYTQDKQIDKHCTPRTWSNCKATTLNVRCGPNYAQNRKKEPSLPAMYNVFAVDTYRSPQKIHKISQFVNLKDQIAKHIEKGYKYSIDTCPLPPVVILNVMIPNYSYGESTLKKPQTDAKTPSTSNASAQDETNNDQDGDGFSLVMYAELSDDIYKQFELLNKGEIKYEQLLPSIRLFSRFAHACSSVDSNGTGISLSKLIDLNIFDNLEHSDEKDNYNVNANAPANETGDNVVGARGYINVDGNAVDVKKFNKEMVQDLLGRFKVIVKLMNYSQSKLSIWVKPIVATYNGTPFLARTTSTFYHVPGKYFAADIDAHNFKPFTRKSFDKFRNYMDSVIFDAAVVIEGRSDDELPERILCSARVSKIGEKAAKEFPAELMEEYVMRKSKNQHTSAVYDRNI